MHIDHPRDHWLALTVAAVTAIVFSPTLGGFFLSDDFSYISTIAEASSRGALLGEVTRNFSHGLVSAGDSYYRPLTYASFALDYMLYGAAATGYRITNLSLHAANAGLVAYLFLAIAPRADHIPTAFPAVLAGLFFGLFPTTLEVAAWISGRFDALATFFLLLTLISFLRRDRWRHFAPMFLALALLSKESGILAFVIAALIALFDAPRPTLPLPATKVLRVAALRIAPLALIVVAYFYLRWQIFGAPFKVYAHSSTVSNLLSGAWMHALATWPAWLRALTKDSPPTFLLFASMCAGGGLCIVAFLRSPRARRPLLLACAAILICYALVFANNPGFSADGRHGRLFYQMLIPAAWLVALPPAILSGVTVRVYAFAMSVCLVLLVAPQVDAWRGAGIESMKLRDVLATTAAALPAAQFGVVFAPEWRGSIPFALNAQAGLVIPPIQAAPLSQRLILQTDHEFVSFTDLAAGGLVNRLKREPLISIMRGTTSPPPSSIEWPDHYWCWLPASLSLREMPSPSYFRLGTNASELEKSYAACSAGQ